VKKHSEVKKNCDHGIGIVVLKEIRLGNEIEDGKLRSKCFLIYHGFILMSKG
jgi:hypothetical protein